MILAAALILAIQKPLGPIVPAGASQSYMKSILAVEDAMEASKFDVASKLAEQLPKRAFKIQWDESQVPAALRSSFGVARDSAIGAWGQVIADFKATTGSGPGDLKVSFTSSLPDNPDGIPLGATFEFPDSATGPRVAVVISLQRGRPAQPITSREVQNEVMYAIACYLGIERSHIPGISSFRTDLPSTAINRMSLADATTANRLLATTEKLKEHLAKKQSVIAARPRLQIEPIRVTLPATTQGEPVQFSIQVTNSGNAPVSFRFIPDCGCLSANHAPTLEAGRSGVVTVGVDTVNFVGELRHRFYVYSNDPDFPYREIPVDIDVEPLFKFVTKGPSVLQMSDAGADGEAYLVLSDKASFKFDAPELIGAKGTVDMTPWQGELPGKPGSRAKGFKLKFHLDKSPVVGRLTGNIEIKTDHNVFSLLRYTFQAQRGILALPQSLYLGEIARAPTVAAFLVSRPGLPFKITKITSDNQSIKATAKAQGDGSEHRVTVEYDGKSDFGQLTATLTIYTDDPKQPKVYATVTGLVR